MRVRWLIAAATAAVVVAGCAGANGAGGPTARPTGYAPTAAAQQAATPVPTADATPAPSEASGPATYDSWVERQGFGGSSGLNELRKGAEWLMNNPASATPFDVETWMKTADHLATWLDQNPASACWTDYHARVRASLARLHDAFVAARDARVAGRLIPADVSTALVTEAHAAYDLPEPAGC